MVCMKAVPFPKQKSMRLSVTTLFAAAGAAVDGVGVSAKVSLKDKRQKPADQKANGVEVLLRDNQVVLAGRVVDRFANGELRSYRWPDGYPVPSELPEVAVSPGKSGRSVTTPAIGLRISE